MQVGGRGRSCKIRAVRWGHVVHLAFVSSTMRGVTTVRMRVTPRAGQGLMQQLSR